MSQLRETDNPGSTHSFARGMVIHPPNVLSTLLRNPRVGAARIRYPRSKQRAKKNRGPAGSLHDQVIGVPVLPGEQELACHGEAILRADVRALGAEDALVDPDAYLLDIGEELDRVRRADLHAERAPDAGVPVERDLPPEPGRCRDRRDDGGRPASTSRLNPVTEGGRYLAGNLFVAGSLKSWRRSSGTSGRRLTATPPKAAPRPRRPSGGRALRGR